MPFENQLAPQFDLGDAPVDTSIGYARQGAATFNLTARGTALSHLLKKVNRSELEEDDSRLVEPDEANKMVPGLPEPFKEPIKLSVLRDIQAEHETRVELQNKISRGPTGPLAWLNQTAFSLLAHATDPIEFGVGVLATGGIGLLGRSLIAGKNAVRSERMVRMGIALSRADKLTYTRLATEGLAGNIAIEPFLIKGEMEDHQDASVYKSTLSVIGGSLGFAGLIKGAHSVGGYLAKNLKSEKGVELAVNAGHAQMKAGKKPDLEDVVDSMVDEIHAPPKQAPEAPGLVSKNGETLSLDAYKHEPFNGSTYQTNSQIGPDHINRRSWYVANSGKKESFTATSTYNPGEYLGPGITVVDNPSVANGIASHSMNKTKGSVFKVKMKKGLYTVVDLDHDRVMPRTGERSAITSWMTRLGLKKTQITQVLKNSPTYREILHRLKELEAAGRIPTVYKGGKNLLGLAEKFRAAQKKQAQAARFDAEGNLINRSELRGKAAAETMALKKFNKAAKEAGLTDEQSLKILRGDTTGVIGDIAEEFTEILPGEVIKYRMDRTLGRDHTPYNALYFKKSVLVKSANKNKPLFKKLNRYDADGAFTKKFDQDDMERVGSKYLTTNNDKYHDEDALNLVREKKVNPEVQEDDLNALNSMYEENKKVIDDLDKTNSLTAEEKLVKEKLDAMPQAHEKELEIAKNAFICITES